MPVRILTIDDSRALLALVTRCFAGYQVECLEAEDGQQGLRTARLATPNLILLDYSMPVLDGYHTLAALRADPVLKTIPVIMLTVETSHDIVMRLLRMGANGYVAKPFSREGLLRQVAPFLKLRPILAANAGEQAKGHPADGVLPELKEKRTAGESSSSVPEDTMLLEFPDMEDPAMDGFLSSLANAVPEKINRMVQQGGRALVIRVSGAISTFLVAGHLIALLKHAEKQGLRCCLIPKTMQAARALKSYPETSGIPTYDDLQAAQEAILKTERNLYQTERKLG